jgi:DNA-binding CsgD family transcriptional regulator
MAMAMGGRFEEAASMLADAVKEAADEGQIELAFQLEAQLNTLSLIVPSAPRADLSRYTDQIEPDSPAARLAAAIEARAAVVAVDREAAADAAKRALGNDGAIFAEEPELIASTMAVLTLITAEELDSARYAAERALAIGRERGAAAEVARGLYLRGVVAFGFGNLVDAAADVRQAMDLARLAGIPPLLAMFGGGYVEILVERDELEKADAELAALGISTGPMPEGPNFSLFRLARGHLRLERGEMEAALEDLLALCGEEERLVAGPGPSVMATPFAAAALVAIGKREKAIDLTTRSLSAARQWGGPATIAHVLRGVAITCDGPKGIEVLREAVAVSESSPQKLEHVHALLALGEALRREGHRSEARLPLQEVFKIARRCGAVRMTKRANAELQATGLTVRRYTPIGVESLTPSERRVAELAASGMTNRQIAQSLFVTVKTVEAHLSATYDKLDIGSRRELKGALDAGSPDES